MKILVCVKRVPDTASKLKIGADGKNIDNSALEYIISPYDEIAVEHAVQIKEKSDAEVVIVSIGPSETEKNMRNCLAMGADRGILVQTENTLIDPFVVANALTHVITEEKPDLILFGIKAVDDDNAQVGAMASSLCNYAYVDSAVGLDVEESGIKAKCEQDGNHQTMQASFPCAVSINKGEVKEPRICSLINIRKARKKELKTVDYQLTEACIQINKMELPPQRKAGKIVGEGVDAVPELFRLLKEEAKIL